MRHLDGLVGKLAFDPPFFPPLGVIIEFQRQNPL